MPFRFPRVACLLVGAPLLLVGCGGSPDAPITGRADRFEQPWLQLGSQNLRVDTVVGDARPVRDANGIFRVSVPVRNVTDLELHIDYTYTFTDENGTEVNRYPGVLHIPSRQTAEAVGNASSPAATKFRLALSYPRIN